MLKNDKILDMEELSIGNPRLHEYYASHTTLIDLSHIKNEEEFKLLQNTIKFRVNNTSMDGYIFYKDFIQPFTNTITHYNNTGIIPFFEELHYSDNYRLRRIAGSVLKHIKDAIIADKMLYEHTIYLKNVPIAKERLGNDKFKILNFKNIKNPSNQMIIEKWIIALLMESNLAISTIQRKLYTLKKILNKYDKCYYLWTDSDIQTCFNNIISLPFSNDTKNQIINDVTSFFTFLTENNYIISSSAWLLANETRLKTVINYKKTAPSEYVLSQLFNALKNEDDFIKIVILTFYTTGMRMSELQSLKKDCLDIRENTFFIK